MSGKALILVVSVTILSLAIPLAVMQRNRAVDAETTTEEVTTTYTATVEVDSIRVISYLDADGAEHPADSTLVAPIPERGPRRFTVAVDRRPNGSAPLAGRAEPR